MSATPLSQQPEYLLFLHIPKTGGTTLQKILERQYGSTRVLRVQPPDYKLPVVAPTSGRAGLAKVVMGHFAFGAHDTMGIEPSYLTIMRDPIARIVSQYLFLKDRITHPHYHRIRDMTLKDYVLSDLGGEVNNVQASLIAGTVRREGGAWIRARVTDEQTLLNCAMNNMGTSFPVVGVLEDFDRSLMIMKMKLGWSSPYYTRVNLTRARPSAADVDDDTLKLIRQHNRVDLELYEYARKRLADEWRMLGQTAESELSRFRRVNQPLQALGTPLRELARRIKWWVYWVPRWHWQQRRRGKPGEN